MKTANVTIKDMAKRLNISVSTVSRALRDVHDINPETRKRVLELAESLDYQPNQVALSLVKSQTKTFGVLVPSIGYSFFTSVLQGIESEAIKAGYSLLICQSNENLEMEKANIQNLLRGQVDGFIISMSNNKNDDKHLQKLINKGIPTVIFDRYSGNLECNKVIIDNRLASKDAVLHLVQNGCRRIAMLAGPSDLYISDERIMGYKEALKESGLRFSPHNITHCDFSLKNVPEIIEAFWKKATIKPDGIFAVSDRIAIYAINVLKKLKVRVPEDVAIIGFNDDPISAMFTPTLSTVVQPTFEIGQQVVKSLLEQINRPENMGFSHRTTVLATKLVIRESSVRKK